MKIADLKPRVVVLLDPLRGPEPEPVREGKQTPEQRREATRIAAANWKKRHPDRVAKIKRAWVERNREHIRAYDRKRRRNAHAQAPRNRQMDSEQENVS